MRTAIIGISGYGKEHLRLLLRGCEQGKFTAQAAVVINLDEEPEGLEHLRRLGCRIYSSVETLFSEEGGNLDLCMIPTPIATHYPFAKLAMEHGCHVLLEKPACGTIEEVLELDRLAESKGLQICIGFQDIYSPQVRLMKEKLVRGEFGRILKVRSFGNWPRPTSYYGRNSWAGRLRDDTGWVLDSPVNNAMAHFLNLMLYWAGPEVDRWARASTMEGDLYRVQAIESFDTASLRVQLVEGPDLFFAVSHSGVDLVEPVVRVDCEKGWITWDHCGPIHFCIDGEETKFSQPNLDVIRDGMLDSVWKRCLNGKGHAVSIRDAASHTLCVNGLHDASEIREIPDEFLVSRNLRGHDYRCVESINRLLQQGFETGKLLKELPSPWPGPDGRKLDCSNYTVFGGGFVSSSARVAHGSAKSN